MTSEVPQPHLTLKDVANTAKTVTLNAGGHSPTVISEGDLKTVIMPLEPLAPTHEGRFQQLFLLGVALAKSGDIGVLYQVFFISEAWMSIAADDAPPASQPSQDPNRKEVLIISHLRVYPRTTAMTLFEMKRDAQGTLVALEDFSDEADNRAVHSPLLQAFAIGFLGSAYR